MSDIVERLRERRGILDNRWPGPTSLELEAAAEIERLRTERIVLDLRIRNQRFALRQNWQIIEMRAQYRRAWYPSPLLRAILSNRRKNPPWWRRVMTRAIFYVPSATDTDHFFSNVGC